MDPQIAKLIDDFNKSCANEGHHWTPDPTNPGFMYCQACGARLIKESDQ